MAIELIGTPQIGNHTSANITLTFDETLLKDDVVIVLGGHMYTGTAYGPVTDGYTEIAKNDSSSYGPACGAWYKKMGASPDSNVVCYGTAPSTRGSAYIAYAFRGVDADVLDTTATTAGQSASTNPNPAAITTQTDNALVLVFAGSTVNDASVTAPSGYSNHYTALNATAFPFLAAGATKLITSAGAENPPSWTDWDYQNWFAITMALKAAIQEESVFLATDKNWQSVGEMKINVGGNLNNVHEGWVVVDGNWKPFWPPT